MSGKRDRDGRRLFSSEPRREVGEELEFHIEQRAREYMAAGMDAETAERTARERIGDYERVRSECAELLVAERRSAARRDWFGDLVYDARYAVRGAVRAPLFSTMAVITLALGIGANSAIFGVVKSVLLDGLPYADPDRLVQVAARLTDDPTAPSALSAGTAQDVSERQRSFRAVAATTGQGPDVVLQVGGAPFTGGRAWVEPDWFDVLGVAPAAGRTFVTEDTAPDTAEVVIITHALWRSRFGGDPDVLSRAITVENVPRRIIGVLPRDYVDPVARPDIYMPLSLAPLLRDPVTARGAHFLDMVGRLAAGATVETAAAEVESVGRALAAEYPRDNENISLTALPLREVMTGDTRTPLLALMASAGLVLLIACANLAAALLSRTIARRKEFAVRISLGAGPDRLVRQLLAESVLLALAGGAVGLVLAQGALTVLRGADLEVLPDYANLSLDGGAVALTFALALLTGIVFGLAPALSVGSGQPQAVLRDESRGSGEARGAGRLRGVLVAGQVALCLSLMTGAALLTRSLWLMASAPLGFEADDVLAFSVPLPANRYPTIESHVRFREEWSDRIAALPGVEAVTLTNFLPTRVRNANSVSVVEAPRTGDGAVPFVRTTGVWEGFFETMRIPVVAGRAFNPGDRLGSPLVAVVSQSMAERFWPGGSPVGARIRVGPDPESEPFEVVGVVRDTRSDLARSAPEPMLYMPLHQGWWGSTFLVRSTLAPARLVESVRGQLAEYDPSLPVANVTLLRDAIDADLAPRRLPMLLMLAFGALALLLACVGIYALFMNMAAAREREFGVRMALGSSPHDVAALMLRQGGLWMGLGLAGGVLGVFVVSRAVAGLVYGIAPLDALSIAGAAAVLVAAAAAALAWPVRRATRADPLGVLR